MKDFYQKSKVLILVLLGILIVFWILYACRFTGGLSSDQSIWGAFGDFFNGVISPIFAAINICIFWYLTKVIDANDDMRQKQDEAHQKAMILMQFRKAEIDRFEDALQESMLIPDSSNLIRFLRNLALASAYLGTFSQSKLDLFGKDQDSDLNIQLNYLIQTIIKYKVFMEQIIDAKRVMTAKEEEEMQESVNKIVFKKNEILSDLQKITLEE